MTDRLFCCVPECGEPRVVEWPFCLGCSTLFPRELQRDTKRLLDSIQSCHNQADAVRLIRKSGRRMEYLRDVRRSRLAARSKRRELEGTA
ncbi:MAG: hypothetical protein OXR62_11035 [Ahrensia sp.]|nr:hypothetical protein [Ahrensia sp.]